MAVTVTFATPLSVTTPPTELGGQSSTVSISTVIVESVSIDPVTGKCAVIGVDNNNTRRPDRFQLSAGSIASIKADMQADLQTKYPSNGATVA